MKFIASKETLENSVGWISKTLPRNPFNPIYAGITITAHPDNTATFTTTDSDFSAHSTLKTPIESTGTVTVSGRLLVELIKNFPDGDITIEKTSNGNSLCEIYNQFSRFTFPVMLTENVPMVPPPPETIGTIASSDLKEIARQVANIASVPKEDQNASSVTSGMKIEFTDQHLICVATDRFRLAVKKVPWTPVKPIPDNAFIVTYAQRFKNVIEGLVDVEKKTANTDKTIALAGDYDNFNTLGVVSDSKYTLSRLLAPEWVSYRRLIPETIATTVIVNRENLLNTLKRMSLIVSGVNPRIALTVENGTLTVTRIGEDGQGGVETIPVTQTGNNITLGFNAYYLIEAAGLYSSEDITIGINNFNTPIVIVESLDNQELDLSKLDYLFVVMPLNLGSYQ